MSGLKGKLDKVDFNLQFKKYEGTKSTRVILCHGTPEKSRIVSTLLNILESIGICYTAQMYEVNFFSPWTREIVCVDTQSAYSMHWLTRWKFGSPVNELLLTTGSKEFLQAHDLLKEISDAIPLIDFKDDLFCNLLHFLNIPKLKQIDGRKSTTKASMSQEFLFPLSMWRTGMEAYFVDVQNPTREEFLFAIMMENVIGKSNEEKRAVEEATLYIERCSQVPDKAIF